MAGVRGGLAAAAVIVAADLVEVGGHPTQSTVHNIVLVVLLGGLIGLAVDLARTGLEREEQVLLERERLHERERIARVVHDGVLQSLAYIHRRGDEIGGDAAELSVIAAEQERSLRRFVSGTGAPDADADPADLRGGEGAEVDLRMLLTAHERPDVGRRGARRPGRGRPARRRRGRRRGRRGPRQRRTPRRPGAHAWLLLEGDSDGVELTIRDDGAGAEPGRPARRRRTRPDGRQRLDPRPGRGPRRHRHLVDPARRWVRRADDGAAHRRATPDRSPAHSHAPQEPR